MIIFLDEIAQKCMGLGELTALLRPLARLRGPTSKGEGRGRKKEGRETKWYPHS